jgi:hypothetical protein
MAIKIASLDTHADGTLIVPNKLGIGTSSPDSYNSYGNNLVVKSTTSTGITIVSGSVDYGSIHFADGSTGADSYRGQIVYNHTTNALSFSTDASERMRITSSGNVGIGTSSPSSLLHIYGSTTDVYTTLQNASTGGRQWIFNATSNASGEGGGRFLIKDGTASATRVTIDSSGNVGIGTSSPSGKVGVVASAGSISLALTDATNNSLYVKHLAGPVTLGTDAGGSLALATNGYTEAMRIDSSQNLLVGTTTAIGRMTLLTPAHGATITLVGRSADGYARLEAYDRSSTVRTGGIAFGEDGSIGFSRSNTGTLITNVIINSSGNVGIGTSSPSYALHVKGRAYVENTSDVISTIASTSTGKADMEIFASSSANARIILGRGASTKWFLLNDYTTDRFTVTDAEANDGVQLAQNATSWTTYSDSRLKDVQGTITDALAKVGQLTGVKFTWKRDQGNPDAKVRVGLIAQDVQAVLPEAVDDESPDLITDEETGKVSGGLGVRYTEVVPLLVNAIKELTARVITLEQAAA